MILNIIGGIASGLWLIILGHWKIVLAGAALMLISMYGIGFVLMLSLPLIALVERCEERHNKTGILFFGFLNSLYTMGLLAIWCIGILYLFLANADNHSLLPMIIWSYIVATGPWSFLAQKDQEGGENLHSIIAMFLIEIAYIIASFLVIFVHPSFITIILVFAIIMSIGIVIQMIDLFHSSRELV
jgi:hypothetical protein